MQTPVCMSKTHFFFLQLKLLSAQAANTNYKPVKKQVVDLIS